MKKGKGRLPHAMPYWKRHWSDRTPNFLPLEMSEFGSRMEPYTLIIRRNGVQF